MAIVEVDNAFLKGKEEILLDPTQVSTKCDGSIATPLLLNDLYFKLDDDTYIQGSEVIGLNVQVSFNEE